MPLEFGIFDNLDDNGVPIAELFETRLKLTEQYDRLGFRSYHIAEHHSTPLGMAPSFSWPQSPSAPSGCGSVRCCTSRRCTTRYASPRKW